MIIDIRKDWGDNETEGSGWCPVPGLPPIYDGQWAVGGESHWLSYKVRGLQAFNSEVSKFSGLGAPPRILSFLSSTLPSLAVVFSSSSSCVPSSSFPFFPPSLPSFLTFLLFPFVFHSMRVYFCTLEALLPYWCWEKRVGGRGSRAMTKRAMCVFVSKKGIKVKEYTDILSTPPCIPKLPPTFLYFPLL